MKKIFISLVSLLLFTSCVLHIYNFSSINYRNDKISIDTNLLNSQKENSPLDYIWISDKRSHVGNNHRIKILSPTIKIISNSKEYIVNTNPNSEVISVYKQGIVITDDFKAYIGKVQLDDGTIIDIPPLSFKKTVYIERYSVISDTINAGGSGKEIFSGTVENYKKQKK